MLELNFYDIKEIIKYLPPGATPCITGAPGGAKSALVKNAIAEMAAHQVLIYAACWELVDFRGLPIPVPNEGVTDWLPPKKLPIQRLAAHFPNKMIVQFLDDLFHADESGQKMAARSFMDGSWGEEPILPNVRTIVAGNRTEDRAGVVRPHTYISNRLVWLPFQATADAWVDGVLNNFRLSGPDPEFPGKWEKVKASAAAGIPDWYIAWVQVTHKVQDFESNRDVNLTPRTLELGGRIASAFQAIKLDRLLLPVLCGTIGPDHAAQVIVYKQFKEDLPSAESALYKDTPLPKTADRLWVVAMGVFMLAQERKAVKEFALFLQRVASLKNSQGYAIGVEIAVVLFQKAMRNDTLRSILRTTALEGFLKANPELLQGLS